MHPTTLQMIAILLFRELRSDMFFGIGQRLWMTPELEQIELYLLGGSVSFSGAVYVQKPFESSDTVVMHLQLDT
jgi:hypothetical protein